MMSSKKEDANEIVHRHIIGDVMGKQFSPETVAQHNLLVPQFSQIHNHYLYIYKFYTSVVLVY